MIPAHHPDSESTCRAVREVTDEAVLSFSTGKDSLAAWVQLRRHGFRVRPVYYFQVPGLGFVERSLAFYEKFFETPVVRVAHPLLIDMLYDQRFAPPDRAFLLENVQELQGLAGHGYWMDNAAEHGAEGHGLDPATCWYSVGVRATDNPMRRTSLRKYGSVRNKERRFFPVWDWSPGRARETLLEAKIPLPVDYKLFGRSCDGIQYQVLSKIKEVFPDDYERILRWFPLAELELVRYRNASRRGATAVQRKLARRAGVGPELRPDEEGDEQEEGGGDEG